MKQAIVINVEPHNAGKLETLAFLRETSPDDIVNHLLEAHFATLPIEEHKELISVATDKLSARAHGLFKWERRI